MFSKPMRHSLMGAMSALALTIPHILGLGLIAFGAISDRFPSTTLALWSAALSTLVIALLMPCKGVVHAPSSVVALLIGEMLATVMRAGATAGITAEQGLAVTGLFVAVSFACQWLIGKTGLAGLARFLPISIVEGFSAGVGVSLVGSQLLNAFGHGNWSLDGGLAWHVGVAMAVALLSVVLQQRWPRFPSTLLSVAIVGMLALLLAPAGALRMLPSSPALLLPPVPDWSGAPWLVVIGQEGSHLVFLALLMAVVNVLEVLVLHQELEIKHGIWTPHGKILMRQSMANALVGLLGLIPSTASASRSRYAMGFTLEPTTLVDRFHAVAVLLVALSAHLWLSWVPTAAVAGALVVAGARMIPAFMLQLKAEGAGRDITWQSWLVTICFAVKGGAIALVAGLIVATTALLRASGRHAVRRMHLTGKLKSRHLRRKELDDWLVTQMPQVAVFELQGIVSFGVAALVVEQIRSHLGAHRFVVLELSRVPALDATGQAKLMALQRELVAREILLVVSGFRGSKPGDGIGLHSFEDLDHALEWIEDQLLQSSPISQEPVDAPPLGDLSAGMSEAARLSLQERMQTCSYAPGELIFKAGDRGRTMMIVQRGEVTISAASDYRQSLRLSVIGPGMFFGEMAFLNGIPRTAFAHASGNGAVLWNIDWHDFEHWTRAHPEHALSFMNQLTQQFIRRFANTSQELRAALE